MERFEPDSTFTFHFAYLSCRLGEIEEGWTWLEKAFQLCKDRNTFDRLRLRALDDPDLEPDCRKMAAKAGSGVR